VPFGIFYEHQLPRPWSARSERDLLHGALAQVELADRLPAFAEGREAREAEKAARLAPAIEAALARRAPARTLPGPYRVDEAGEVARARRRRFSAGSPREVLTQARGHARAHARERVQGALARYVRGADDAQLERRFGSPRVQRALFGAMARAFEPELSGGFQGRIVYELQSSGANGAAPDRWTIEVRDARAVARAGAEPDPAVLLRMPVADFARILAGTQQPMVAILEGRAEVEGDAALLRRLGEMFGGPPPTEVTT
jgi:hypothetical protein